MNKEMNSAIYVTVICHSIFAIELSQLRAGDLTFEYKGIVDGNVCVEAKNVSDSDVVIMSGRGDMHIKFGVALFKESGKPLTVKTVGHDLAMFERMDFILLPANYSRRFECAVPGASAKSEVIQLVVALNYLSYNRFSALMKQRPDMNFSWIYLSKSVIYNRSKIEKLGLSYFFGRNRGGSKEELPPMPRMEDTESKRKGDEADGGAGRGRE